MMRTQISLPAAERRVLDVEAARTGRSVSALIREAIETVYGVQRSPEDDVATMRTAFGTWRTSEVDGAGYVYRLRTGSRLADTDA